MKCIEITKMQLIAMNLNSCGLPFFLAKPISNQLKIVDGRNSRIKYNNTFIIMQTTELNIVTSGLITGFCTGTKVGSTFGCARNQ